MIKRTLLLACAAFLLLAGGAQAQTLQRMQPVPQAAKPGTFVKIGLDTRIVWKTPKPAPQRVAAQADETSALALVECYGTIVSSGFYFCPGEPYTVTATFSNSGTAFEGDLYMLLMVQDASDGTLYIYHQSQPAAASIAQGGEQQVTFQGQIEAAMPYYDSYIVGFSSDLQNLISTDGGTYGYLARVGAPVIIEEAPSTLLIQGQGFGRGACIVRLRNITGTDWSDDLSLTLMDRQGVEYWITDPIPAFVLQGQAIDWELYYDMRGVPLGSYEMSLRFNADGETVASSYRLFMLDGGDTWPVEVEEVLPVSVYIDGLEYTADPAMQTASVTGYTGEPVDLVIPATVNIDGTDYAVTAIGESAFMYCHSLVSATVPEGVTYIGKSAFDGCHSLTSVSLPEGLQTLDIRAFGMCPALTSIDIPSTVSSMSSAFYGCASLADVHLAEGLKTVSGSAFVGCALTSIVLPSTLQNMDSMVFLYCPLEEVTCLAAVPPMMEGGSAFDGTTYATATLHVPEGTRPLYQAATGWMDFFGEATVDGLVYTFDEVGMTAAVVGYEGEPVNLAIPASVNIDGTDYAVAAIGDNAFYQCESLQSIVLPEGVQSIGDYAFSNTMLEGIVLPSTLAGIGNWAFLGCTALADITCQALVPPAMEGFTFGASTFEAATLTVPQEAEEAYRSDRLWALFYTSIQIDGIFYGVYGGDEGATVIGSDAGITNADIPAVVAINGADYPVVGIGEQAFYYCEALQRVTLPAGLQAIGNYAFHDCLALESISIPEGVAAIGEAAFAWCESLQSITLPSTLQSIGEGAFWHCPLTDVHCHALVPPVMLAGEASEMMSAEVGAFDEATYETAVLHVPSEAVGSYQAAQYWEQFLHIEDDLPPVSISSMATGESLARYANGIITASAPADITVYAQSGAQVRHAADAATLSLAGLPRGTYIICIEQGGERQVMKVVR